MNKNLKRRKKQKVYYIFDFVFLFVILYFLYNGVSGNNGLLNLIKINDDIKKSEDYFSELKKRKEHLLIKNSGLYEENLDFDLLEEQAKNLLGYIGRNNEFVILLNKNSE
jgi:cell division protein FtsB